MSRGRIIVTPSGKTLHVGGRIIDPDFRLAHPKTIKLHDARYGLNLSKFPTIPNATTFHTLPTAQPCLTNILLNGTYGCCTQADKFHRQALRQAVSGLPVYNPPDSVVLAAYTRDGGMPGDNGCDEQVVMTNERTFGDPSGPAGADGSVPIDKSSAFVEVDATNFQLVRQCATLFVGGSICMGLPDPWVASMPSQSGWTWSIPVGGAPSGYFDLNNGHCYTLLGQTQSSLPIGSWGMFGNLTPDALAAGAVAANGGALYFVLDRELLANASLLAPDGADWATVEGDFAQLTGASIPPSGNAS